MTANRVHRNQRLACSQGAFLRIHSFPVALFQPQYRNISRLTQPVNAAPNFIEHPKVINGCTDLFVAVFGDNGRPARSAVGMGSLPGNISVEIEAVVLVK